MAEVIISEGRILGGKSQTENGTEYYEFMQIPFAEPPVGKLRFMPPQPPKKWDGVRDTTLIDMTRACFQLDLFSMKQRGSEDCLYLNVYTPRLPNKDLEPLPVVVYFHSGAFVYGSSLKILNSPNFLMEQNVVVVIPQYRVGMLGFLSLDIPEAAGNMGLKDQVMALRWLQQNIEVFGGDKNNVTLFGISSGAASIEYHLLSKLSKGLFHKAIINSGSTLNHWAINYKIRDISIKVAKAMGYQGPDDDSKLVYNFLMDIPIQDFKDIVFDVTAKHCKGFSFGFVPSVEPDFKTGHEFLTTTPYKVLKEGNYNKVPVLRGITDNEGLEIVDSGDDSLEALVESKKFSSFWEYSLDPEDVLNIDSNLLELYTKGISYKDQDDFGIKFFGDFDFLSGILTATKLMVEHGIPMYAYIFCYEGNLNIMKTEKTMNKKGIAHGGEFHYLMDFDTKSKQKYVPDDNDHLVRKRMTTMWTNFARTGNPTPTLSELIPLRWPKYDNEDQRVLLIDKQLSIGSYKPHTERIQIYESLYEKYQK